MIRPHQLQAVNTLRGSGIEIGALHEPFPLPSGVHVSYVDTVTPEEAARLFPEIDPAKITPADRILNLDTQGLAPFADISLDFVIISHVLEHLANPIRIVGEVFRVLHSGGRAVIAVPDKRFTFDRGRKLTPFEHLCDDYQRGVTENTDEHYLDFIGAVAPEILVSPPENIAWHLGKVRSRREHAHVWDSETFRDFLVRSLALTGHRAHPIYESRGDENEFEYFGVWERDSAWMWRGY